MKVIRAFSKEKYEMKKYKAVNKEYADASIKAGTIMGFFIPILTMLISFATLFIVWIGGQGASQGTMEDVYKRQLLSRALSRSSTPSATTVIPSFSDIAIIDVYKRQALCSRLLRLQPVARSSRWIQTIKTHVPVKQSAWSALCLRSWV